MISTKEQIANAFEIFNGTLKEASRKLSKRNDRVVELALATIQVSIRTTVNILLGEVIEDTEAELAKRAKKVDKK